MVWDDMFKTGVEEMDEQHKEIFRRLELLKNQKNPARIPSLIEYFEKYMVMHFDEEQKLHQTTGFPQLGMHKSYHRYYLAQFAALKKKLLGGGDMALMGAYQDINDFMDEWLVQHIRRQDMEFAYFYKYGADEAGITSAVYREAVGGEGAAPQTEEEKNREIEEALENTPGKIDRKTARFNNL